MTPADADRLYESVLLAAPMALLGVVLFVLVWRWPNGRGPFPEISNEEDVP